MYNEELEIFRRKKGEESKTSNLNNQFENSSSCILPTVPTNKPKQEDESNKQSALEKVLYDLLASYHFINFNRQLYVFIQEQGYWKLIPSSNSNYELRSLIPLEAKRMAMKINFSSLYDWLLCEAENVEDDFFQERWDYINFKNCALNWKSGKTKIDRKKYTFRYALQIDYTEEKSSGIFEDFLKNIFGDDKSTRHEFYKYIALCLSNIRKLKYCAFLFGPSNSGKTTVLSVLKYVLGAENCSSLSFSQISSNEFALTQLQGKRLNLSGEVSGATNKKIDILKSITGNDFITASYKCRDHFQFDSSLCMLVFACNCLPNLDNYLEMESFLSRVIIFPFSNQISRDTWDKNILKKLTSDTQGIIQCVLKGLKLLERDNYQILETAAMKECKLEYAGTWESFSSFCDKYIIKDPENKLTSAEIQQAYHAYCNQKDLIELYANQWVHVLRNKFLCTSTTKTVNSESGGITRVRAYKGIAFSSELSDLMKKQKVDNNCVSAPSPKW